MQGLQRLISLLKSPNDQRAGLTDLTNASRVSLRNSTSTVVSATTNTNGVIIRTAVVTSHEAETYISVGGDPVISASGFRSDTSGVGAGSAAVLKNLIVPAGVAIEINAAQGDRAAITYEVL